MADRPVFLLGLDTEADDQWSRDGRKNLSVRNAEQLPRLQALCRQFGVRPTYLVTHEMATRPESSAVLRSLVEGGDCEIGAHLHPWSSPPYREQDLAGTYPSQLPDDLLERQLRELTGAIREHIGVQPATYRAGRLGMDGRQLRHLETLGYLVDTSVDPLFNERHQGGPSFPGAPLAPYHPDRDDLSRPGSSPLLEIPVSSATRPFLPKRVEAWYAALPPRRWRPLLRRAGIRAVWLRPSFSSAAEAHALARGLVARGVPTLNMLFHSSELLPGGSPYYATAAAVDGLFDALARLFELVIKELGAEGRTYSAYAKSAQASPRAAP